MTTIKTSKATLLVVEVPEGADDFWVNGDRLNYRQPCLLGNGDTIDWLPPGNYTLLGRPADITEEVAAGLVDEWSQNGMFYEQYPDTFENRDWYCETGTASLLSLLTANGVNPAGVVLLKIDCANE